MTTMPARAVQTADAVLSAILILQDEGIPSSAHQHKSALRGKDGTAFPGYRRVFDTLACCIIHSKSLNLAQIKKDLRSFNIESLIVNHRNHYHICRDEIECDFEPLRRRRKTSGGGTTLRQPKESSRSTKANTLPDLRRFGLPPNGLSIRRYT